MARISVHLEGGGEVKRAISRVSDAMRHGVVDAVSQTATDVEQMTKEGCPVDTGRLRSSYRATYYKGGMAAEVGTDVQYAPFVEFGTLDPPRSPQPHLFPAWEFYRPHYEGRVRQAMNMAVKKGGR